MKALLVGILAICILAGCTRDNGGIFPSKKPAPSPTPVETMAA